MTHIRTEKGGTSYIQVEFRPKIPKDVMLWAGSPGSNRTHIPRGRAGPPVTKQEVLKGLRAKKLNACAHRRGRGGAGRGWSHVLAPDLALSGDRAALRGPPTTSPLNLFFFLSFFLSLFFLSIPFSLGVDNKQKSSRPTILWKSYGCRGRAAAA